MAQAPQKNRFSALEGGIDGPDTPLGASTPERELPFVAAMGQGSDAPIGEGDSLPVPALAASPPGFLLGSSGLDQEVGLDQKLVLRTSMLAPSSMLDPSRPPAAPNQSIFMRTATERPRASSIALCDDLRILPGGTITLRGEPMHASLRGQFSMRGQLMHVFLSYRVVTEGIFLPCCTLHPLRTLRRTSRTPDTERDGCAGPAGNGLAERVAQNIRKMSTDPHHGLQLPRHGW